MLVRKLEIKDAPYMYEWMHDENVTSFLKTDFSSKTIDDAENFIKDSWKDNDNLNLAIVSDVDEYMGTVSLKHLESNTAEFAIVIRSKAMGKGYSWFAMERIMEIAFEEIGLDSVYWCVSTANNRAIRFYEKHSFHEIVDVPQKARKRYDTIDNLKWYSILKGDKLNTRDTIAGCKIIRIKTVPTVDAGELSFFEGNHDFAFPIKRIYYITKVPEGVRRGFHAHKELKQLLFCPYGRIQLILENNEIREEIELSDPSVGVIIDHCVWREMLWLQKDSVLCVAASDYYDPDDYIRDYNEFKNFIK